MKSNWHILVLVLSFYLCLYEPMIWASTPENLSSEVCEQQRAQTSLRICAVWLAPCYSLIIKYHIKTCHERDFIFLASLCSWAGWFESHFFENPEDRFSCNEAHMTKPTKWVHPVMTRIKQSIPLVYSVIPVCLMGNHRSKFSSWREHWCWSHWADA